MNFHPTLLAFIHTHAHRHRGRNPVLPLRPPPTLPRYFSKGIPRGLPKHSDSCIPPQQRHVFPSWLPPHCLWTAVTWSLPPLMPHKDSQENNPFCCFSQRPIRMEIHAIHPSSPHSSSGLALTRWHFSPSWVTMLKFPGTSRNTNTYKWWWEKITLIYLFWCRPTPRIY